MSVEFAKGLFFNEPHPKAPDFVLGSMSINPDHFIDWLRQQPKTEKGYVRLAVKRSKEGKIYVCLDDWKPETSSRGPTSATTDMPDDDPMTDDIPF